MVDAPVQWNFQKFLINEKGELADVAFPKELPDEEKIIKWIESK